MSSFNLRDRSNPPFASYNADKRFVAARTSSVTIFYYHWVKENFGTSTNVQSATAQSQNQSKAQFYIKGKIEGDAENVSVSKNLEQPSANFNFTLYPTKNWKQEISPGDWLVIYFHSSHEPMGDNPSDTKNLVLIGNVDRISRIIQKEQESDKTTLRYQVSGRNFGKVFEQTDIWYDPYAVQASTLDVALRTAGLQIVGSPDTQVTNLLDIFLGKGGQTGKQKSQPLKQWFLPTELVGLFGSVNSNETYFDTILERQITPDLPGYKPQSMITPNSNGSLWDTIKRSSNQLINEVFLEEVRYADGDNVKVRPTIVVRPRPYQTPFFNNTNPVYSQLGKKDAILRKALRGAYQSLQDLSEKSYVEVLQNEVIYENLGRDDHARINMLWFNTNLHYEYILSPNSNLSLKEGELSNPTYVRPSIMRHGLRRMDALLDFCHTSIAGGGVENNSLLFQAWAAQLYDMNYANHLYEQGTIECTGVLEAELGKALVIRGKNTEKSKIYYIEGYEHKWSFPNLWTTVFTVSKGQFKTNDGQIFIDISEDDNGAPDSSLDFTYIAKTNIAGKD